MFSKNSSLADFYLHWQPETTEESLSTFTARAPSKQLTLVIGDVIINKCSRFSELGEKPSALLREMNPSVLKW
jgi:hypothetical protein